jgi:hypothetical protein
MLRGLGDLFADCNASVHTVLQFNSPGADGLIYVRAFPADSRVRRQPLPAARACPAAPTWRRGRADAWRLPCTAVPARALLTTCPQLPCLCAQTAEDFMTYLRTEGRGPSSSGQKHTPQQRAAVAPSPHKENASPCKAWAPAAEQDMPTPGRAFGQALANSQRSAAKSPSPGPLLGSPARSTPLTMAPAARPGLCALPASTGTHVTFSRPKQFSAECPPGALRAPRYRARSALQARAARAALGMAATVPQTTAADTHTTAAAPPLRALQAAASRRRRSAPAPSARAP